MIHICKYKKQPNLISTNNDGIQLYYSHSLFKSLQNICYTTAQNHTVDIVKAPRMINMVIKIDIKH